MNDKLLGALGLARRAGALAMGFDSVKDAIDTGTACMVLIGSELSEKSVTRVQRLCEGRVEVHHIPYTQEQLADMIRKPVGVLAVTDSNLAALCRKNLPADGQQEQ